MKKYYAVKKGRLPGIYDSWGECQQQVMGYSGAIYQSFTNEADALAFINQEEASTMIEVDCEAYVDGSYHQKTKQYSYGVVLLLKQEELHFKKALNDPEMATMRNVAGEIEGARKAMEYCLEHHLSTLRLYYDYAGIEHWCTGAWKATKKETKAYQAFYQSIKNKLTIEFVKVKSHSGNRYNDLADQLAKEALGLG